MELNPSLVITTGLPCTGKTTTLGNLIRRVSNSLYLSIDSIRWGILCVQDNPDDLPDFRDYIANDSVFPNNAREIPTIFGEMIQIDPQNAFYRRHAKMQSHLTQAVLAKEHLDLGKVPILDSFSPRQLKEGLPKKFMEQDVFRDYPKHLIHFVVDESMYHERINEEAKNGVRGKRIHDLLSPIDQFRQVYEKRHGKMMPDELKDYEHLVIDTTHQTPKECADQCIDYISN